jgi:antitoxin (DNA-binding transcriptional repressor) of toxin-antitoxin stability system
MHNKNYESISATEFVRNISTLIDRVRFSQKTLKIVKGKQTVAELIPPKKVGYPINQLVHMLNSLPKLDSHMAEDISSIRKQSTLPNSIWD